MSNNALNVNDDCRILTGGVHLQEVWARILKASHDERKVGRAREWEGGGDEMPRSDSWRQLKGIPVWVSVVKCCSETFQKAKTKSFRRGRRVCTECNPAETAFHFQPFCWVYEYVSSCVSIRSDCTILQCDELLLGVFSGVLTVQ